MLNLYAEQDGGYRHIASVKNREAALVIVQAMMANGTWPKGHDAVLRQEWYLVEEQWESL